MGAYFINEARQARGMYMFSWGRFPAYTAVITDADYARLRDRFDAPGDSAAIEQLGIINVAEPEQALDLFLILQQALPEESEIGGFVPSLAIVNAQTGVLLFTGGSYCLYMGITGLRGWYETRHAPD